jgi:agmatine deiminase
MLNKHTLIPDWEKPEAIGLVWPERLPGYSKSSDLIEFYKYFINLLCDTLPEGVKIRIYHRKGLSEKLKDLFNCESIDLREANKVQDIWIRDFGPFWIRQGGAVKAVKALYSPGYLTETEQQYAIHDELLGCEISRYKPIPFHISDTKADMINMDGGNLVHNGIDKAIVSNRVITDNEHYFIDDITKAFKAKLGISDLILVPVEWGDDTGHVDGMVRFLDKDSVIVSKYQYNWERYKGYISNDDYQFEKLQMDNLAKFLDDRKFNVFRMPNGIPIDTNDFESAEGNYTNFLRLGNQIYLPQYGNKDQDKKAAEVFNEKLFEKLTIIKVEGCNTLAAKGGVLNCITSHIYN